MNCFVDTNVLVYAIDERTPPKRERASEWLRELSDRRAIVLSPQSLNEFYMAARIKLGIKADKVLRDRAWGLSPWCIAPLDAGTCAAAWDIEDETGYRYWDCLLLASASRSDCEIFLSEDMQQGRRIGPLTIVNPFKTAPADILPNR